MERTDFLRKFPESPKNIEFAKCKPFSSTEKSREQIPMEQKFFGKIMSKICVYITTSSPLSKISKTFSVSVQSGRKCCSIRYLRVENSN